MSDGYGFENQNRNGRRSSYTLLDTGDTPEGILTPKLIACNLSPIMIDVVVLRVEHELTFQEIQEEIGFVGVETAERIYKEAIEILKGKYGRQRT